MPLPRTKPAGWGFEEKFTSAQVNSLDENIAKAPNVVDGDLIESTGLIKIDSTPNGGALELAGPGHVVSGSLDFDGPANFNGADINGVGGGGLDWDGPVNLGNNVDVAGDVEIGGDYKVSSRTVTRTHSLKALLTADWIASIYGYVATSSGGIKYLCTEIDLPHGSTLTSVTCYVKGVLSGPAPPLTAPTIQVQKLAVATGALTDIGAPQGDPSYAVAATYTAHHSITKSGLSEVIDRLTYTYHVLISTGGGGDVATGFQVFPCKTISTVTAGDLGSA